ncbi:MAG: tryptophan--tRNA ligase [Peptoniphilaceae bacterium]|nr:tryptophan--tRNA ligase [Peptoniphilaceae bacterium]MDD7383530.1 tryptophan--tRNA ligase [Peptoniphilaceae bacterium]MDY3738703.1 tryptophan--tRNA ligase [Peptoniphilaceae bacterium]
MTDKEKKVVLSLVQPSGELTIGNYLGAIRNFSKFQDEYNCFFAVADMHAITVDQVPADLRRRTKEVLALFIASGIDPEKCTLFIQSQVPEHAQLSWVLNSQAHMGQLSRMTQFKSKSKEHSGNINSALFTYPVLMAADILLYQTDLVPVGEDQNQHLELARDLAQRFNARYSETFTVPNAFIDKEMGKIYSLKDPDKKMSKSDPDSNSYILINDKSDVIRKKIKRAVTDDKNNFSYNDEQKGLKNLINIYSAFSQKSVEEIVKKYRGENYSNFKEDLGDLIVEKLSPIQEKYNEILNDKKYLTDIYTNGAIKAEKVAYKTLSKVYKKIGFLKREML